MVHTPPTRTTAVANKSQLTTHLAASLANELGPRLLDGTVPPGAAEAGTGLIPKARHVAKVRRIPPPPSGIPSGIPPPSAAETSTIDDGTVARKESAAAAERARADDRGRNMVPTTGFR